jgi:hypothetical protein
VAAQAHASGPRRHSRSGARRSPGVPRRARAAARPAPCSRAQRPAGGGARSQSAHGAAPRRASQALRERREAVGASDSYRAGETCASDLYRGEGGSSELYEGGHGRGADRVREFPRLAVPVEPHDGGPVGPARAAPGRGGLFAARSPGAAPPLSGGGGLGRAPAVRSDEEHPRELDAVGGREEDAHACGWWPEVAFYLHGASSWLPLEREFL